jgi:hypothetical protein
MNTTQARPGRETSEFKLSAILAIVLVVGAIAGLVLGRLDFAKALEVAGLGLGLIGAGYSASRGLAKQGPPKRPGGE